MIANKHISKIIIAITAVAVVLCMVAPAFASDLTELLGGTGVRMEYETELFDTSEIIELNIIMDEDKWESMLSNAMVEEYYTCDVVVNGTTFKSVAIRPKGNTSLSAIAMDPDTDRFSLKLEFDHFVDGQTCFGLDKLILNNNYADATNMKEAIIYDMYQYLDADASLYNYAKVSVNGEYWGVYLALEAVEQSFMLRNYGTQDGELYKPDTMEMGGDNAGGGFSMNPGEKGGADLNYVDDDLDSYQSIWDSEITSTSTGDHRRVVTALKNISEGNDLEEYLDVDNILKYMAVHTFAVNMDSLSGTMSHNYYLYEYEGQLNIFPWDYNLSWGGMSMGLASDGTTIINDAIDTPFNGTDFFDALLEDEEYCARYHEYLQQLVDEYVNGGRFDEVYERIRTQIDDLVEEDPTAFYTADEYEVAAEMLYKTVKLRAESVKGQLDGTIPSTSADQGKDRSVLIDGSEIDVAAMGTMNFGAFAEGGDDNGGGGQPGNTGGFGASPPSGDMDFGEMPEGFDPSDMPDMGDFDPANMPEDFDPSNMPDMGDFDPANMPEGFDLSSMPDDFAADIMPEPGEFPSGGDSAGAMNALPGVIVLGLCFVLAIASLVVLKFVKHKG